ncbi:unannotated protein [freshwater metagenome]|uniref:Unannotated protein n=1 Tax=freshwater metagenome TaxID=449393 RepID=A0A6J6UL44_9ZZZZ
MLLGLVVLVEARDVGRVQVDERRAEDHPLRDALAGAGAFLDPDGRAGPQALDLGGLAEDRHAVGRERQDAVDRVLLADALVADDLGHELERMLVLQVEVVLGERELGGREGCLGVRGDLVDAVEDRAVGVGADLEAGAVLPLVHVRVHVADDRVLDIALRVGEARHRADVLHLVHGGRERDARPGHPRDLRAPAAACDDDDVRLDVALIRPDAHDLAVLDIDAEHLGIGRDGEGVELLGALAHDRAGAQRVDDADARGVEAAEDDGLVDVGDELLHPLGRDDLGVVDAEGLRRRHAAMELLHALGSAGNLDAAALGEHAHLLVLAHALVGELGHLLGVVDREDEVGRMAGGAARVRQRALVDLDEIAPAETGQVVGQRIADDSGSDDDGLGRRRQCAHRCSSRRAGTPTAPASSLLRTH